MIEMAARDTRALAAELRQLAHELGPGLSAGNWLLPGAQPAELREMVVAGGVARVIAISDAPGAIGRWSRLSAVCLAWLLPRALEDPTRVARFSWSDLGRLFGHRQLAAKNADALRAAVRELARPQIHRVELQLVDDEPVIERVVAPFVWPPRLHRRGDGRHHPGRASSELHLESALAGQFEAGAWTRYGATTIAAAPGDLARRLLMLLPFLAPLPGVPRRMSTRELLGLLGSRDSRADRAQRHLADAGAWIGATEPGFRLDIAPHETVIERR